MDRAANSQSTQGPEPTRGPRTSLGRRIVRTTVVLALAPMAILGGVILISLQRLSASAGGSVAESRAALSKQVVSAGLEGDAQELGNELDRFVIERVRDVKVWAADPLVRTGALAGTLEAERQGLKGRPIDELESRFRSSPALGNAQAADYLTAQIEAAGSFAEVLFTDANGFTVAFSAPPTDFVQHDETWWQNAWAKGLDVGPVTYNESARVFSTEIAVRISSSTGAGLGVIKGVLNLGVIQQIADAHSPRHNVTILDDKGRVVAETATRHDPSRVMNDDVVFPAAVSPDVAPVVEAARSQGAGSVIAADRVWAAVRTGRTQQPVDGFPGFNWVVLLDVPTDTAFAPLASIDDVRGTINRVAGLLGVLVVLVVVGVGVVALAVARPLARQIVRPIVRLRDEAGAIATTKLPALVDTIDRVPAGQALPTIEPLAVRTGDEVEELADKFNSVVATAGRLAAEQVESRRQNLAATFVSMGRRNQKLIGRQLAVLDELERHESDPDALEGLFKLDQLATRMRRNAESLLVLAGQAPARKWTHRVPMHDVIRAAVSEIEEFSRVDASSVELAHLRGDVLAEVAHLLAELCENATAFSPPDTTVEVIGRVQGSGYRISVVDHGIGLSEEELARANDKLANPDGFDRVPSQYLGLFVVGRLAVRLGIEVHLFQAASGGLIARVTLPPSLLDPGPQDEAPLPPPPQAEEPPAPVDRFDAPLVDAPLVGAAPPEEPVARRASIFDVPVDDPPAVADRRAGAEPADVDPASVYDAPVADAAPAADGPPADPASVHGAPVADAVPPADPASVFDAPVADAVPVVEPAVADPYEAPADEAVVADAALAGPTSADAPTADADSPAVVDAPSAEAPTVGERATGAPAVPVGDESLGGPPAPAVEPVAPVRAPTPASDADLPKLPVRRSGEVREPVRPRPAPMPTAPLPTRSKRPTDWVEGEAPAAGEVTVSGFRRRRRRPTPAAPPVPSPALVPAAPRLAPEEAAERARATIANFMSGVERGRRAADEDDAVEET